MSTDQPSWATAPAVHLPESTSEMFVYQPQGDVDSTWMTVTLDWDFCPLRVEMFTPDDQYLQLRLTSANYDHSMRLDEGSCIDLEFASVQQRAAFFRMILELADWIKEHHTNEHSTGNR